MRSNNITIQLKPDLFLHSFLEKQKYSKIGVMVDENTEKKCYPLIQDALPAHSLIRVRSGEEYKTFSTCHEVWKQLAEEEFDRYSGILILGGGVLGDMGGFCAATFKRGVDFILIPTTLLAQVDAGIGGKLGINFEHYKNQIGVFHEATITLISPSFLDTLPQRELRSGFAEIIKHCLISDADRWEKIQKQNWKEQNWKELVQHSVAFKERITKEDYYEKGIRKILNFGHTIGHAVESHALHTHERILHGEAVAIGLITETHIAHQKKSIDQTALYQITDYILSVFEKNENLQTDSILNRIYQDKKNRGGKILMAFIKQIGKADWDIEVSQEEVYKALNYYNAL